MRPTAAANTFNPAQAIDAADRNVLLLAAAVERQLLECSDAQFADLPLPRTERHWHCDGLSTCQYGCSRTVADMQHEQRELVGRARHVDEVLDG